jgi:hypothetical protein
MGFWRKDKKETSVDTRKENFEKTIEYGTGMPIDIIYSDLQKDYGQQGYDDAHINPDISYKENRVALIKSNLEVKFRQIRTKYNDELRNVNSHIESLSNAGLVDVVERLKTKKEVLETHLQELTQMENDLNAGKDYMTGIFRSYERGFLRGLASVSLGTLRIGER